MEGTSEIPRVPMSWCGAGEGRGGSRHDRFVPAVAEEDERPRIRGETLEAQLETLRPLVETLESQLGTLGPRVGYWPITPLVVDRRKL
jgi:hypothetical protein